MASTYFKQRIVVRGSGYFPIDMLRYDRCCPDTEGDSGKIIFTMDRLERGAKEMKEEEKFQISLKKIDTKNWYPQKDRWESFGWKVTEHKILTY